MFSVIFEVHPRPGQWDNYLALGKVLRPELEQIDGFIDNVRYRSLTREGWILSLSGWRDEKALVRWRTATRHHEAQRAGRSAILRDYHLRVGEITRDSAPPPGHVLRDQRFDETEVGEATTVTLIDARHSAAWVQEASAQDVADRLGLAPGAEGLVAWDVFEAVLTPGDVILLASWKDRGTAEAFSASAAPESEARLRMVRIVRDYGMFDRREAPQYYAPVAADTTDSLP